MEPATLNWCSLKPIKINNLRLTFSWGSDQSKTTICSRIDLRLFTNGSPTTYGVNLTRWELIHLGIFIQQKLSAENPQPRSFYELNLESTNEGLVISKRRGRIFIKNIELPIIEMFIPGLNFMACLMKPEEHNSKVGSSLEDVFIFSTLIKSEIVSIDEALKEEEMLSNAKLSAENLKHLKQNCMKMWECYSSNFGAMKPTTRNDFLLKFSGEFLKSPRDLFNECPALLRSLTLIMKTITEYK